MAPFRVFLVASIIATFFLKRYCEAYLPSRNTVVLAFEIIAVETLAWLVWRCILFPILFSPLRTLPGPSVCPHYLRFSYDSLS